MRGVWFPAAHTLPQDPGPSVMPVFDAASPQAAEIQSVFFTVLILCAVIFALVAVLIVIAMFRFRARKGVEPRQDFGSEKAEIAWIIGPTLVVGWLVAITIKLVLTISAMPEAQPDGSEPADLVVTGHQWWWEVEHVATGIREANEIYIPVGKKMLVRVRSADVAHSFWVPRLARKIDAIPGIENYVWLEASQPGVYRGWCAEFCGAQHAGMRFRVYALPPDEYEQWQTSRQQVPQDPQEADAQAGKRLFFQMTCANCHAIEGTDAVETIGPDLTHFADRKTIGAGTVDNTPENLVRWLEDPQALKPGCKMPNFHLTPEQIRLYVAYLETLR